VASKLRLAFYRQDELCIVSDVQRATCTKKSVTMSAQLEVPLMIDQLLVNLILQLYVDGMPIQSIQDMLNCPFDVNEVYTRSIRALSRRNNI
jgi:hypothetical protein